MYGEGNNTKLIKDIVNGTTQVTDGGFWFGNRFGAALISGFLGGKVSQTGEKDQDDKINFKQTLQLILKLLPKMILRMLILR